MHPDDKRKAAALVIVLAPLMAWLAAVRATEAAVHPTFRALWTLARLTVTGGEPLLLASAVAGLALAILALVLVRRAGTPDFGGAAFRQHLRGTRVVGRRRLAWATRQRGGAQIIVAGIPMPIAIETLHLLVGGSTGSGKSVLIREMAYSALLRGDRIVVADSNGDMLAKFYRPGDVILNPYDSRGRGWTFFNEIRAEYDFKRFALSLVPRGQTKEEEEWCAYARLLLRETARKLSPIGQASIAELFRWTTIATPSDLQAFLAGTAAESLFVGADKALASARFVLSAKLPEHLSMPAGDFSLRSWLADPKGGNLFITWREDMAEALRPLISAGVDVLCTSILSLGEDRSRRIWMFLDELASLEKLPSLEDAATKGRKAGLARARRARARRPSPDHAQRCRARPCQRRPLHRRCREPEGDHARRREAPGGVARGQATPPRPRLRHDRSQQSGDHRRPGAHRRGDEEQDDREGCLLRGDQPGAAGGADLHG